MFTFIFIFTLLCLAVALESLFRWNEQRTAVRMALWDAVSPVTLSDQVKADLLITGLHKAVQTPEYRIYVARRTFHRIVVGKA